MGYNATCKEMLKTWAEANWSVKS